MRNEDIKKAEEFLLQLSFCFREVPSRFELL